MMSLSHRQQLERSLNGNKKPLSGLLPFSLIPLACIVLISVQPTFVCAQEFEDPFADLTSDFQQSDWQWDSRIKLLTDYNKAKEQSALNPNIFAFEENRYLASLEIDATYQPNSWWQFKARGFVSQEEFGQSNEVNELLEGYFSFHNDSKNRWFEVGRIKPQWSNGYNWGPANLLMPYRDRPSFDQDNLLQQQGWDMLRYTEYFDFGSITALIVDFDEQRYSANNQDNPDDYQSAVKVSIQNGWDASFIVHKLENRRANYALTFSQNINDTLTLRSEWAQTHDREHHPSTDYVYHQSEQKPYDKWVVGLNWSMTQNWDFSLEMLSNEHGYSDVEWSQQWQQINHAYQQLQQMNQIEFYANYLGTTLAKFAQGQLRQNYLFVMLSNAKSASDWQYQQSVQYNLDDDSQLHRLTGYYLIDQSWTLKLQYEYFSGERYSEYGLIPNRSRWRLVVDYRI